MEHQRAAGVDDGAAARRGIGRLGILLLTAIFAAAIYRALVAGDAASVAFVLLSYGALLLLLRLLRAYEVAPPEAAVRREGIRRKVWALCTLLTAMFAWKVAGVVPWPVAVGVWAAHPRRL